VNKSYDEYKGDVNFSFCYYAQVFFCHTLPASQFVFHTLAGIVQLH